jgi:hypothetical protein
MAVSDGSTSFAHSSGNDDVGYLPTVGYHGGVPRPPGVADGRAVCLCWRLDEPGIVDWQAVDAGVAGR